MYYSGSGSNFVLWGDTILHELGHSFGFRHTHDYATTNADGCAGAGACGISGATCGPACSYLGCASPRDTIMCYSFPHIFTYVSTLNNRVDCTQRTDVPASSPAPFDYGACSDTFISDSDYLINNLNNIP